MAFVALHDMTQRHRTDRELNVLTWREDTDELNRLMVIRTHPNNEETKRHAMPHNKPREKIKKQFFLSPFIFREAVFDGQIEGRQRGKRRVEERGISPSRRSGHGLPSG